MQDFRNGGMRTYDKKEKQCCQNQLFRTLEINQRLETIQGAFIIYEEVEPQ